MQVPLRAASRKAIAASYWRASRLLIDVKEPESGTLISTCIHIETQRISHLPDPECLYTNVHIQMDLTGCYASLVSIELHHKVFDTAE